MYLLYTFLWFAGPAILAGYLTPKVNAICKNPNINKRRVESTARYIKMFVVIIAAMTFIGSFHFSDSWMLSLMTSIGLICGCYYVFNWIEKWASTYT